MHEMTKGATLYLQLGINIGFMSFGMTALMGMHNLGKMFWKDSKQVTVAAVQRRSLPQCARNDVMCECLLDKF